MRTIPTAELNAWLGGGLREFRVRSRPGTGSTWTNLSNIFGGDWTLAISSDGDRPDQPSGRFVVRFIKHTPEASASPGVTSSPLNVGGSPLHPGRVIEVDVRVDNHPWRMWLQGEVQDVDWPGSEVVVTCLTFDQILLVAQIEAEEWRIMRQVQDEIHQLIQQWVWPNPPGILVLGTPSWSVAPYRTKIGSLGEHLRNLAQEQGWDFRYRYAESWGTFAPTLYEPPRSKTATDVTIPASLAVSVPDVRRSLQYVRNRIIVDYAPGGSGDNVTWQRVIVEDTTSINEYRRRPMILREGDESSITNSSQATALGNYALNDLSKPLVDGRYEIPFLPWLEVHDLVTFEADNDHFDHNITGAVVGVAHRVDPENGAWTEVEIRGGAAVGSFFSWYQRRAPRTADVPRIMDAVASMQTAGVCGSTPLTFRVDVAFTSTPIGYGWRVRRFVEGVDQGLIANGMMMSDVSVADVMTGWEHDPNAVHYTLSYRVELYRTDTSDTIDTKWTQNLWLARTACP
jgi:hypothetical protein